ncbi:hypothetical protein OSB04_024580 [Centaurea solstitialis]|uniref:Uncharacterized protein n=1 Tax=Centaurea solstitialis TaxID=347529 RepID=A0AA38SM11_9ASTR|nr:hypothetical protein OSB04_024580 [Centaurea solstitialis]
MDVKSAFLNRTFWYPFSLYKSTLGLLLFFTTYHIFSLKICFTMCSFISSSFEDLLPSLVSSSLLQGSFLFSLFSKIITHFEFIFKNITQISALMKEGHASQLQHPVLYLRGRKSCRTPSSKRDVPFPFPPPLIGTLLLSYPSTGLAYLPGSINIEPKSREVIGHYLRGGIHVLHHCKDILFSGCAPTEGEKFQQSKSEPDCDR